MTVVALTGVSLLAVPQVYAQTTGANTHMNFFQELVQFISQKFGLDKTQVQTAITDFKAQRKATITPRPTLTPQQIADSEKVRLDKLVAEGKITPSQETAIINEIASLRTKYNFGSWKDLAPADRKAQATALREEIVSWAKSQGIDSSYVMPGFGMVGRGLGMERGEKNWGGK